MERCWESPAGSHADEVADVQSGRYELNRSCKKKCGSFHKLNQGFDFLKQTRVKTVKNTCPKLFLKSGLTHPILVGCSSVLLNVCCLHLTMLLPVRLMLMNKAPCGYL